MEEKKMNTKKISTSKVSKLYKTLEQAEMLAKQLENDACNCEMYESAGTFDIIHRTISDLLIGLKLLEKNSGDKALVEILAKKKGWSVDFNDTDILFGLASKAGQDFNVSIDIQPAENGEYDFWTLRTKLIEYYDSFDVDYETYIWLGSDGHGKNGAPHRMKDLWNDMNDCHEKIYELAYAY